MNRYIRHSKWLVSLCGMIAMSLLPARAQDLVRLQSSAAGGPATNGSFSLFSAVGAAVPSGIAADDGFTLESGSRSLTRPPVPRLQFTHTPVTEVDAGTPVVVSFSVMEANALTSASLNYRRGGEETYSSVDMTPRGAAEWQAEIPGEAVTSAGVVYHLQLLDPASRPHRSPPQGDYGIAVRVADPGLETVLPSPGDADQSGYRLVSVPLNLTQPSPASIFVDDLGAYDPDEWRFFELPFDQELREFPDTPPVSPGRSFWLITRAERPDVDTGPGVSVNPARPYSMPVHPRWNLIATPFHFPIATSAVRLESGSAIQLRAFDGAWNDPINDQVTELHPFAGYAVFNPSPIVDTLHFDPRSGQVSAKRGENASEIEWAVRIEARSGGRQDVDNVAGVSRAAASGIDAMDHPEPPAVGSFVSVYFVHPDWDGLTTAFSTDFRPTDLTDGSWTLHVASNTGRPVHLSFAGLDSVPVDYQVVLVDELAGVAADLRDRAAYVVADPGTREPRSLRLLIGPSEVVERTTSDLQVVPQQIELAPIFPNPVTASMTIRYGLTESTRIVLRLYDSLGRLVHQIRDRVEPEGYHVLVWESPGLASGVYHLELQAGGVRRSQTLTLVK